jgi:NADPH:quinone reductase-like Zn-dependent oxidoreductase
MEPDADLLSQMAELVDAGKLHPIVENVFPLSEASHAQELSKTRHVRGKIVLKVV